jgi:hypothetical protein
MVNAMTASAKVAALVADDIQVQWVEGSVSLADHWALLLDNKIPPSTGLMVTF